MSLAKAKAEFGSISSRNSKMPGSAFAISPSKCITGAKLAEVKGSVCHKCYALKNEKFRPSVKKGWGDNYLKATKMIAEQPGQWAKAMSFQISWQAKKNEEDYHRWFDAGDLQSVEMLEAIALTCENTPHVKHWLPTREAKIVLEWRAKRAKANLPEPSNLVIRISSTMIGDKPQKHASHTSTVHVHGQSYVGHECPSDTAAHKALSPEGKANCGPCRACWTPSVPNISYPLH